MRRFTVGHDEATYPRRRITKSSVATAILFVLPLSVAVAQDQSLPSGFETQPILKSSETRDKDPIVYPETGKPEILSVIGTIEPGGRTALHKHPVPVFVYVLEGEIELRTEGGSPQRYRAGEAYIESLNRPHQLFNKGDVPARILAVVAGEQGKPATITLK